jgi:hypothetical protein
MIWRENMWVAIPPALTCLGSFGKPYPGLSLDRGEPCVDPTIISHWDNHYRSEIHPFQNVKYAEARDSRHLPYSIDQRHGHGANYFLYPS